MDNVKGSANHRRFNIKVAEAGAPGVKAQRVLDGVRAWFASLREEYRGRFPDAARAVYHAAHQCLSLSGLPFAPVADLTGANREMLVAEYERFQNFVGGGEQNLIDFRSAPRSRTACQMSGSSTRD